MKKDLIRIFGILLLLYILQFLLAPMLFPIYYPSTNESTGILFGSIAAGSLLGMLLVSSKLRYWLLCDIPYLLLMCFYSNNGAYGIGIVGIPIDGNQLYYDRSVAIYLVLVVAAITVLIQFLIWVIVKTTRMIVTLIHRKSRR